jgi:hypothetical protein
MGFLDPGFPEVVESSASGGFPGKITFMKEVEMAFEGVTWFGGPPSECAKNSVTTGQPNGQEARFPLAAEIEQNPFILKWLAHVAPL